MTDAREQVIAGLEAAIRDINCPLQYSPLMMEASKLLRKVSPPEPTEGQVERAAQAIAAITDPGRLWSEITANWQEHHRKIARAAIRAMPLQERVASDKPVPEVMLLQARKPDGGEWTDIWPAQLSWIAKEGNEVRAMVAEEGTK